MLRKGCIVVVYILLGDGFEECEALVPADLLRRAKAEVKLVAVEEELLITGANGIKVEADILLQDTNVEEMDMLILPGGVGGVESIRMNLFAVALITDAYNKGAYLGAICAAPTLLANMGILDRRRAVCYPGMEDEMGSAVVQRGATVVEDGHIITANAAGSSFEFGLKLVEKLCGIAAAKKVKESVYYKS